MYACNRTLTELQPESFEFSGETYGETSFLSESESPFSEAEEMELAVELLEVTSEAELEQFLGKLFKKAWSGIKSVGSKLLRPLGGVLKTVAKKALPFLATAAGTFFGGPAGGAIAGKLGSLVSQALEAETAGMASADRDLEKCRQFVRMAGAAAKAAALAPPGTNPIQVAQKTLANAAQEKIATTGSFTGVGGPKSQIRPTRPATTTMAAIAPASSIPVTPSRPSPPYARPQRAEALKAPPSPVPTKTTGRTVNPYATLPATPTAPQRAKKAPSGALVVSCTCGQPFNCKCGKTGRWVRRGRSIVIINC